jgi:DNA-binding CsgD family transcriptional regulator
LPRPETQERRCPGRRPSPTSDARAVPDPAAAAGLTAREYELRLVAQHQTNNAITVTLFIASSIVKTHVAPLLAKLDADNRAHLAIIAVQRGLLTSQSRTGDVTA